MNTTDQLLAQLPHLPADVLARVRDQATVLLSIGPKAKAPARGASVQGDFARDLYDALAAELQDRTRAKSMPFNAFATTADYTRTFAPAAKHAGECNAGWFVRQSKLERLSMAGLYASLVLDYMQGRSQPLTWQGIASSLRQLPAVVDTAFPGYARAGLLGRIQRLRTAPRT